MANSKLFVDGAAQSDFNAGKHVVGLKVNVKCADGCVFVLLVPANTHAHKQCTAATVLAGFHTLMTTSSAHARRAFDKMAGKGLQMASVGVHVCSVAWLS